MGGCRNDYRKALRFSEELGRWREFFFFLAGPHGMWDLSSQSGDPTKASHGKHRVFTTGQPGKFQSL